MVQVFLAYASHSLSVVSYRDERVTKVTEPTRIQDPQTPYSGRLS